MEDFAELRNYITIILRRWWVVILALVVTFALGYGYVQRQDKIYKATASVLVGQSIQAWDVNRSQMQASEELAQTYAALAKRQPVLEGAVDALGLNYRWQRLRGMVSAQAVANTQLVEISVEAESREEAILIADEVAKQLILLSPTALRNQEANKEVAFVNQRLANLQERIEKSQAQLDELELTDVTTLTSAEVVALEDEVSNLENIIFELERNYAQLLDFVDSTRSNNYIAIIDEAQASSVPVSPNVQLILMISSIIGLTIGIALAFVLEHLDDTIKATDDLGQMLGLTPLGAVRDNKNSGYESTLITSTSRFSPESEAYRMIRSNIQFMSVDSPNKSIMVTSAVRGEGKSSILANLGVVMAQAGLKTVIVDTDLRRPVQHQIFDLPNNNGLTELLRKPDVDVVDFLSNTHVPGLQVLTSGVIPPNPSELLGSQRMKQVMDELGEKVDMVLYDSPPAVVVADAAILAKNVDGTVLVVQVDETRRDVVRQALFNLTTAGATMYGIVLNRVSKKRHSYYYQGYYYKRDVSEEADLNSLGKLRKRLHLMR